MNPIINLWWLYGIGVVDKVLTIAVVGVIIFLGTLLFMAIIYYLDYYTLTSEERETSKKLIKKLVVASIVSCVIAVTIPNKKTIYAMFAANYITSNNVQAIGGDIKGAVDYIFEKIEELEAQK